MNVKYEQESIVCEVELIFSLPDWVVMMMDCFCVAEWN